MTDAPTPSKLAMVPFVSVAQMMEMVNVVRSARPIGRFLPHLDACGTPPYGIIATMWPEVNSLQGSPGK